MTEIGVHKSPLFVGISSIVLTEVSSVEQTRWIGA